ncbi:hypothetical protein [Saccharopolyspora tripterygii]
MNPPSSAAAIAAPRTGERLHVAVETSAGETYLIAFIDSARDGGCEPCELSPDEARDLARAVLRLLEVADGQVAFPLPRSDQQLNLAIETDDREPYLVTWLGRTACEAGYEPSELSGAEARQLARALQDLADVAEGA